MGYRDRSRSRSYSPPRRGRESGTGARREAPTKTSLLIKNLSKNTQIEDLRRIAEAYGEVKDVYLPVDYYTKERRDFGFVEFGSAKEAEEAIASMDGMKISGKEVEIALAQRGRKKPNDYLRGGYSGGQGRDSYGGYGGGRDGYSDSYAAPRGGGYGGGYGRDSRDYGARDTQDYGRYSRDVAPGYGRESRDFGRDSRDYGRDGRDYRKPVGREYGGRDSRDYGRGDSRDYGRGDSRDYGRGDSRDYGRGDSREYDKGDGRGYGRVAYDDSRDSRRRARSPPRNGGYDPSPQRVYPEDDRDEGRLPAREVDLPCDVNELRDGSVAGEASPVARGEVEDLLAGHVSGEYDDTGAMELEGPRNPVDEMLEGGNQ